MAKEEKKKPEKVKLDDKDHPSMIEVGSHIRLRVLEDFNIEKYLPKWVRFTEEWNRVQKDLGIYESTTPEDLESKVRKMTDKSDEEKSAIIRQAKNLIAMKKALRDDDWHIREKHEREVDQSILKQARYVRELSVWDKIRNLMHVGKRIIPVDVAMDELLEHIELTSTPELEARLIRLREIEANMRKAGQYNKADTVKSYRKIVAEEAVVCVAGFTSYVSEDTMLEFLRKSERGTMVDFLRYYEDEIPPEVVDKKVEADKLMVFDNYCVAYYADLIHKAAKVDKKVKDEDEKKERTKRRDPILFGLIKNSRKLYYICDWVTDTDDLTLEKLEKELGVTRGSLVKGAGTTDTPTRITASPGTEWSGINSRLRNEIRDIVMEDVAYYTDSMARETYTGELRGRFSYGG